MLRRVRVPEEQSHIRFANPALLLLLLIMLGGTALRIAFLPHEALEGDELFSRRVALLTPVSEIAVIRNDLVHPPLYYFLLQATTKLWGDGVTGIRAFSLLSGIASIGLLGLMGRMLPNGLRAGLLAATILAVNQTHIFYSQEARSYAWYALLVLLLVFWVWRVTRPSGDPPSLRHWVLGTLLMTMLVYTHYVGAIYIGSAVLAILLSHTPRAVRIATLLCAAIAALCFVPWIIAIAGVYKLKRGISDNLDWQGHPTLYSLKQIFASALGILNMRGGTTLVLAILALLILAALLLGRQHPLRQSPVVLTLLLLAVLPPLAVFFLSRPPFDLPLFGIRHFLPSIPLLILLCCYGLVSVAQQTGSRCTLVFSMGTVLLLAIVSIPTLRGLILRPSRIPYDLVSQEVTRERAAGVPAYATWFYGVGEPVNFYCASACVAPLPQDTQQLPSKMVLLFRANSSQELWQFQQLQQDGYAEIEERYYSDGEQDPYGTTLAVLTRFAPHRGNTAGSASASKSKGTPVSR
jgi:uncharacterized membrane protein